MKESELLKAEGTLPPLHEGRGGSSWWCGASEETVALTAFPRCRTVACEAARGVAAASAPSIPSERAAARERFHSISKHKLHCILHPTTCTLNATHHSLLHAQTLRQV